MYPLYIYCLFITYDVENKKKIKMCRHKIHVHMAVRTYIQ